MKVIDRLRVPTNYVCYNCKFSTYFPDLKISSCSINQPIPDKNGKNIKTRVNYNLIAPHIGFRPIQLYINNKFILCSDYEYKPK